MYKRLRSAVKGGVNRSLYFVGKYKSKNYNTKETIVLCASPRGGSTWLAEVLNTLPGYSILWEPLTLNVVREAKKIGFTWRTYIPPGKEWREAEEFIGKILTGEFLNLQTLQSCSFNELKSTKAWIVKFCRAHLFLKWLTEKFETKKPILLIRHPCAVVSSQMRHGNWNEVKRPYVDPRFLEDYPQFERMLSRLKTWEEVLVGTWCLEYFVPLSHPKPHPWLLVTYEDLLLNGEKVIGKIFSELGFNIPEKAINQLRTPSSMTKQDSPLLRGGNQLSGWTRKLKKEQIKRIIDVVERFGLDFYTDKPEPDYDRLYGDNPVRL